MPVFLDSVRASGTPKRVVCIGSHVLSVIPAAVTLWSIRPYDTHRHATVAFGLVLGAGRHDVLGALTKGKLGHHKQELHVIYGIGAAVRH